MLLLSFVKKSEEKENYNKTQNIFEKNVIRREGNDKRKERIKKI